MEPEITLRIVLEAPPAGVDFGIQKGRGSLFEVIQKQRSKGPDLSFEFSVGVRNADGSGTPDFSGPMVQGPRGGRFVYVDIGKLAGQLDTPWSRRLKVPLTGITAAQVRLGTSERQRPRNTGARNRQGRRTELRQRQRLRRMVRRTMIVRQTFGIEPLGVILSTASGKTCDSF